MKKEEIKMITIQFKELTACFITKLPKCVIHSNEYLSLSSPHKLLIKLKDLPPQWRLLLNQDNYINCASLLQSIFIIDQT